MKRYEVLLDDRGGLLMKTATRLMAALAVAGLLSGCGVLNAFIPDQTLIDPLGIDGVEVALEPEAASISLELQQAQSVWSQRASTTLHDIDTTDIPAWVVPASLSVDVGFEGTVTLSSATATSGADFDETLVFDAARLIDASISDDQTSQTVNLPTFSTPPGTSVTLQKGTCSPLQCTYTATSGLADFVIAFNITGADMDALYDILSTGSETNTSDVTLEVTATGNVPADTVIEVVIDAPTGTLTF